MRRVSRGAALAAALGAIAAGKAQAQSASQAKRQNETVERNAAARMAEDHEADAGKSPAKPANGDAAEPDPLAEQPDDITHEVTHDEASDGPRPQSPDDLPPWRVTLGLGGAWINGKPASGLLQDGALDTQALDVDWQPSALGLRFGVGFLASNETHDRITSRYQSTELRLALTYVTPLPWDSFQVILFAGGFEASHHVELDDGDVNIASSSSDFGPQGGVDLATPPLGGLRLLVRLYVSEQKVHFSRFDFSHDFVERGALIGGSYAF